MDRPLCGLGHQPFLTLQALSGIDTLSANRDHTILLGRSTMSSPFRLKSQVPRSNIIGEVSQEDNHGRAKWDFARTQ